MTGAVALALSPHLDDAAFSCGGTLARLGSRGWRVVVATLFTASMPDPRGFALACQLDKGLGPEVDYMALRREEDAAAMAALGAEAEWLPFAEAPHRGYGSARALFDETHPAEPIRAPLAAAIAELVGRHRPDLILAPQAVGGHVDHVETVRAIDAAGLSLPVAWWRDYPYTVRPDTPAEPFRDRFGGASHPVELEATDSAAKRAACLSYRSQIGFQFGGVEALDRALVATGGTEHFAGARPPC